ncbi:MAG: peptidoglycan-binding domain-containing protein, partial [Pseudomonadota bacterium]
LLAARDVDGIKKYLGDCLYCFNRDALRTVVRETQQAQSLCAIEERWLDGIGGPTAVARLEAFLKTAKCKRLRPRTIDMIAKFKRDVRRADIAARRASAKKARLAAAERLKAERALQREEAELAREERAAERRRKAAERKAAREAQREQRLAKLTPPPKTDTPASDATAFGDETSETAVLDGAAENETGDASPIVLARRLQTELKRVGCLYGRVDGIWGRGSAAALTRFAKAQGTDITDSTPSEDLIFEVEAVAGTVCAARKIVKKPRVRKTRKVRATSKPKTRKTRTVTKPKTRTKTTYRAPKKTTPKKTYSKPKKTYTKPKRTYSSGGGGSSSPTISRQCQRYGNFC